MIATLTPVFNNKMEVAAYSIFTEKAARLLDPGMSQQMTFDGAAFVDGFEIVKNLGIETLTDDKEVFVEVNRIALFGDLASQVPKPHERIVLLLDASVDPEEEIELKLRALKEEGFRLAMQNLAVNRFETYRQILQLMDYVLLDQKKVAVKKAKLYFNQIHPNVKLCAVNVDSVEDYKELTAEGRFDLYEGQFFRMPVRDSETDVSPIKMNYLRLLNTVNEPDYDLTDAAAVIERDAALIVSLLGTVNRLVPEEVTGIRQAAALLGQKELKKWINTAVTKELCADKPSEIMRMSLLRAGFAERLGSLYELEMMKDELFLMGLFSVVDIMLDKPMEEALEMVHLSERIDQALLKKNGELAPVLLTVLRYENADWAEVSRLLLKHDIEPGAVYQAYLETLKWYREVFATLS